VQRLQENIARSEIASLPDLKLFIHGELLDFQRSEAVLYPRKERRMQFLIAARMHNDRSYAVWKTTASRLAEVRDLALVGWEEPLYEAIAKRLYRADLTLEQAELAAAYVLTIGEETSNFIRGPMTVAIVRDSEIRLETSNRVRQMVERLKEFESSINNLFLACAENTPPRCSNERSTNSSKGPQSCIGSRA